MTDGTSPVRVRIAPSPTGDPHVGTAYIALFNYVFAKKHGGKFVLRIEDTDQTRARSDSEQMIFDALHWCGLSWDEGPDVGGPYGPYRQSERTAIYRDHVNILLDKGAAYRCFCTEERLAKLREQQKAAKATRFGYDRNCRDLPAAESRARADGGEPFVVRMKMPISGTIAFDDILRTQPDGTPIPIVRDAAESDDQVLLKSDGFPTYHLANVVDDHLMKITHVVRAEEWISSTQKHVVLYDAFGWQKPQFAHMPLLRNADKSKISKRKNPVSINYYRDTGILPQALLNFLGTMGWSFGGDREKFTLQEMIDVFTWKRISLGGPVFDLAKLQHMNEQYIAAMSDDELADALMAWRVNRDYLRRIAPLVKKRIKKLDEVIPLADFAFTGDLDYSAVLADMRGATGKDVTGATQAKALLDFVERFEAQEGFAEKPLEELARAWAEGNGWKVGQAFMLLRIAVTGRKASPGLFESMVVIGKEIVRRRLRCVAEILAKTP